MPSVGDMAPGLPLHGNRDEHEDQPQSDSEASGSEQSDSESSADEEEAETKKAGEVQASDKVQRGPKEKAPAANLQAALDQNAFIFG